MKYCILIFSIAITSCSRNWDSLYLSQFNMGVKTINQTILKIEGDQFELKHTGTALNYDPPQEGFSVTTGTTKWSKNTLELYQYEKTTSQVVYGKPYKNISDHPDSDTIQTQKNLEEPALKGIRKNAAVAIDTIQGQIKYMDNSEPIILDIIKQSNSTYFVNEKFCFVKYHDNISNNVNKCDEIQQNYK